jgi:hypothetical protein
VGLRGPGAQRRGAVRPKPVSLAPIKITNELIDLIIVQHATQRFYHACANDDHCTPEGEGNGRCFECEQFQRAADRLRVVSDCPAWTTDGLPDGPDPPRCLGANLGAQKRWRRAWALRQTLIKAAKRKLASQKRVHEFSRGKAR